MNTALKALLIVAGLFLAGRMVAYALAEEAPDIARAHVLSVQDGDSFKAEITVWIDQTVVESVRLRNVDTPELKGRCAAERWAAQIAKQYLANAIEGKTVDLTQIGREKFGRVLSVVLIDGRDIGAEMVTKGMAREYDGKTERKGWC